MPDGQTGALVMLIGDADDEVCGLALPRLIEGGFAVVRATALGAPSVLRRAGIDAVLASAAPGSAFSPGLSAELRALVPVPILVLAPADADADEWQAAGANVVLRAPIDFAAVEEALRPLLDVRSVEHIDAVLHGPEGLIMDVAGRRVFALGRKVELTRLEFDLLHCLLARRGEVVSAERLAEQVWSYTSVGGRNYIETQISRLRSKLRGAALNSTITTVRGVGYVVR